MFVFVSGGVAAIQRGFGVAGLHSGRVVDPERTVFRLASVSKAITATAALQLVERGHLCSLGSGGYIRDEHAEIRDEHWEVREGTEKILADH